MRAFVPATDEVGRLQRGKDVVSKLFREFAELGHYKGRVKPSKTRQGIYAVTPNGTFLASCNTRRADVVAKMMRRALTRWKNIEPDDRSCSESLRKAIKSIRRWEDRYPEDGLVLRITSRDLPGAKAGSDWKKNAWNHDFAWFRKSEALQFVPKKRKAGQTTRVPDALVRRLVRLHFLDHVRGQVSPFRNRDIRTAEMTAKITAVRKNEIDLELRGTSHAVQAGRWAVAGFRDARDPGSQERGMQLRLLGKATWNTEKARFQSFEAVATGTRWGGTQFNGRSYDLAAAPIGFVLELGSGKTVDRTVPARIWNYGWR